MARGQPQEAEWKLKASFCWKLCTLVQDRDSSLGALEPWNLGTLEPWSLKLLSNGQQSELKC